MSNHDGGSHSRKLAIPGEFHLQAVTYDNGMADAAVVPIQNQSRLDVHIFGGLTKLEAIASRVAGGMTDGRMIDPIDEDVARIAKLSTRIARAIIAECQPEQDHKTVPDLSE